MKTLIIMLLLYFAGCVNHQKYDQLIESKELRSVIISAEWHEAGYYFWTIKLESGVTFSEMTTDPNLYAPHFDDAWVGDTLVYRETKIQNLQTLRYHTTQEAIRLIYGQRHNKWEDR